MADRGSKAAEYDALAYAAVQQLIDQELAVVWHEVEAKLAERPQTGAPRGINPHHLSNARRSLVTDGVIVEEAVQSHGSQVITVWMPADQRKRKTAINKVAGRKRVLESRYLGWANVTAQHPNLIGDGGERVVHESLTQARAGYGLINPKNGEVASLFGDPVPGGTLDNAAKIALETGTDLLGAMVLVEVKNKRGWFYPAADDIYQLLFKAATLQQQHPGRRFIPVLVARAVHYLTYHMAKHLGFFVIEFDRRNQPVLPHWTVSQEDVAELQVELGYVLTITDQAMPGVRKRLELVLPREGPDIAKRWAIMAPSLVPHFGALRNSKLSAPERAAELSRLYQDACSIEPPLNNWH